MEIFFNIFPNSTSSIFFYFTPPPLHKTAPPPPTTGLFRPPYGNIYYKIQFSIINYANPKTNPCQPRYYDRDGRLRMMDRISSSSGTRKPKTFSLLSIRASAPFRITNKPIIPRRTERISSTKWKNLVQDRRKSSTFHSLNFQMVNFGTRAKYPRRTRLE